MKHPKFRARDVLTLAPEVRDEVYDFIRNAVDVNVPAHFRQYIFELQHVGSYTWGDAKLSSDIDFNIALRRDTPAGDFVSARRWFYSPARAALGAACHEFEQATGLKIDLGMVDLEAERYNTFVSLRTMTLHHRTTSFLTEFEVDSIGPIVDVPDEAPIDLATFSGPLPPSKRQHLTWDARAFRWRTVPRPHPWKRTAAWIEDRWAGEVDQWRWRYGEHFIEADFVDGQWVERVAG